MREVQKRKSMQVFPDGLFFTVPHGMAFIRTGENRDHGMSWRSFTACSLTFWYLHRDMCSRDSFRRMIVAYECKCCIFVCCCWSKGGQLIHKVSVAVHIAGVKAYEPAATTIDDLLSNIYVGYQ